MSVILQEVLDFAIGVFEHPSICCEANNGVKQRLVPQSQANEGCVEEILEIPMDTILPVCDVFEVIFEMDTEVYREMCPIRSECKHMIRC